MSRGLQKQPPLCSQRTGGRHSRYSTTEGYCPLRQFIADRYKKRLGLSVSPDEILITNGSQQSLDLIGKVLIDAGDHVAIERPGYLGAIQAFSLYEPCFHPVILREDGPDPVMLADVTDRYPLKLFYGVPNSQNPSGITYSIERRREIAGILEGCGTLFVEDDAYGELNFSGTSSPSMREFLPEQTLITGSFSKILAPGLRMGWVVAPPEVMDQIVVAKQASDLHSNYLSQRIAYQYLCRNNIDARVQTINAAYRSQCDLMIRMFEEMLPESVSYTRPRGGCSSGSLCRTGSPPSTSLNTLSGSRSPSFRAPRFMSTGAGRIRSGSTSPIQRPIRSESV